MRRNRRLFGLLVAAAAFAALAAGRHHMAPAAVPGAEPGAAPGTGRPGAALQMIGLAAPTVDEDGAAAPQAAQPAAWTQPRDFPEAVLALQRAPLDADTREQQLQQLLARWAEVAPEQAARWALATPGQGHLLAPLHDRWLQQDPRSATVFAGSLPRGAERQALLDEALLRWTAQDGPSARDWLRSYAPLPELDAALARQAGNDELARQAPLELMDLVARISAPERRWESWQALARNLHDIDPAHVEPLLARAPGLTPAERATLLAELR